MVVIVDCGSFEVRIDLARLFYFFDNCVFLWFVGFNFAFLQILIKGCSFFRNTYLFSGTTRVGLHIAKQPRSSPRQTHTGQ